MTDIDQVKKLFRDRPRRVRRAGRTHAALYRALERASDGESVVYFATTRAQAMRVFDLACAMAAEEFLGAKLMVSTLAIHIYEGRLFIKSAGSPRELECALRGLSAVIADDLSEWADQYEPYYSEDVRRIVQGLPPKETT